MHEREREARALLAVALRRWARVRGQGWQREVMALASVERLAADLATVLVTSRG